MRITQVRYHGVAVPPTETALFRIEEGLSLPEQIKRAASIKWIVEVETDAGITGIGESHRGLREERVQTCGKALIGTEPLRMNLRDLPIPSNTAYDVYEIALYDMVGKALGRSVCQLLGGSFRDWVPIHYWMGKRNPEESAQIALEGQQKGFTGIKIKCGGAIQLTLERVKAISQVVGSDFELVLDSNGGFFASKDESVNIVDLSRQLEAYNVTMIEDPFPREEVEATAELRKRIKIPIAYHALTIEQVIQAIKLEACDYMNVGGDRSLPGFVLSSDMADAAKIPSWHGSSMELGIRDAAYLHACAASRGCTLSSDIMHHLWQDDLIVHPIELKGGRVRVPEGPGLGVELDYDALDRYLVKRASIVC